VVFLRFCIDKTKKNPYTEDNIRLIEEVIVSKLRNFSVFTVMFFFAVSPILSAQVIKDDFRVNDDTVGGDNIYADVEILENGEEIIVWQDKRNGYENIYGQAYNADGSVYGVNFKVSTLDATEYEYSPAISTYGDSLLVIWQYGYCQWLSNNGSPFDTSFALQSEYMFYPDVAIGDSGLFVVWQDNDLGSGTEIFVKRFDFDGDSLGKRILVDDDSASNIQEMPRIAMADDGDFVVVWHDFRNGNYDIYGQLFDSRGYKIGSNFIINDDPGTAGQSSASCAMDSVGDFVVVWHDGRNENVDIYGQRFNQTGATIGSNFMINDDLGTEVQWVPFCAMDKDGNFVVVWEDARNGNYDIYGQLFDNTGMAQGTNFRIDQCQSDEYKYYPKVSMNQSNFVVTWQDERNYTSIYKRRYNNDGIDLGDEIMVNDIDGTSQQEKPAVDANRTGDVVVTWDDNRNPSGIYFQRFTAQGEIISNNIRVSYGAIPDISVHKDGSYVITYSSHDYMGSSNNVYCQRYDAAGNSIGSSFRVNDTSHVSVYASSIDMDTLGNFTIAWYDSRSENIDIYAQRFDTSGNPVGANFKVNDEGVSYGSYYPSIAYSLSGQLLVTWYKSYDIFGQVYDKSGNPIGTNFRINSNPAESQYDPDATSLTDSNFIVVWEDYRYPQGIYGQVIDPEGNPVDTSFKISDVRAYNPSVDASPEGGFVVSWQDDRDGNSNIYAQQYKPDYSPDGSNYKVNNEVEGLNPNQYNPDVTTTGTNIIFTWQDARWQKGWDIAAKVFSWEQGGIEDVKTEGKDFAILGISSPILTGKEWLTISIDSPSKVDFKIMNVVGIVVSSKKLNYRAPGIKKVTFDASKLPSGPYFLSFKTKEGKAVKKAIVIR